MTDHQVLAACQWALDHVESIPGLWRALVILLAVFVTVTADSVACRLLRSNPPLVMRLLLILERPVLLLWRGIGWLAVWVVGAPPRSRRSHA